MNPIVKFFYRIYQLFIGLPLFILGTATTAIVTTIGCTLGNGNFWGFWPQVIWGKFNCNLFFLPVKVEGTEKLVEGQSYVFAANHQGFFDIWLTYGYLGRHFNWLIKKELEKVPLVGYACKKAGHIFVERGRNETMRNTYDSARKILRSGVSLCVFVEGTRTKTGQLGRFKKGAFLLADDIKLPIVPITINGSFKVFPRGLSFVNRHPLTLTVHDPIPYVADKELQTLMDETREAIQSALNS